MADTTQGDTDGQYLALLVLALIALIAGLLIHSFIIGVNVTDWWKGRSVTPVDLIVTSLGISRMCAQLINNLCVFMYTIFLINLNLYVTLVIFSSYDFFIHANFWLTSLLSVVLFLKISNFHTRLFLYLRRMIVHRTGYLIGVSGLLSAFISLVHLVISSTDLAEGRTYNTTMQNVSMDCTSYFDSIFMYTISSFFPLLFYSISSVLLFASLYHHTKKMKMSSNLSINLDTYYSVMKLICFTFIYNTIYFVGHVGGALYCLIYCVNLDWLYIVLNFLPVLHSSYLIYTTAKLRSQMSKVLQNVIDFVFQRKNTETRENILVVTQ